MSRTLPCPCIYSKTLLLMQQQPEDLTQHAASAAVSTEQPEQAESSATAPLTEEGNKVEHPDTLRHVSIMCIFACACELLHV